MQGNSTKVCTYCRRSKPIDQFNSKRHGTCRACKEKKNKQRDLFGEFIPESKTCTKCLVEKKASAFSWNRNTNGKRYRKSQCSVCEAEKVRIWKATPEGQRKDRASKILRAYGITLADYETMLAIQQGRCAICQTCDLPIDPRTKRQYEMAVDHDHATGAVRGLLCPTCNNGLGCFKDNPVLLHAAIAYLKKSSANA